MSLPELNGISQMNDLCDLSILVVGLGNPILGDDGVGWRVAEKLQTWIDASPPEILGVNINIETLSLGGLSLMEHLIGYTHVIIIDSINNSQNPPGYVCLFPLEDLPNQTASHLSSAHDTSLQNALQVGRSMGADLPEQILIVTIQSPYVYYFSEELSLPVAAAVPKAAEVVIDQLIHWCQLSHSR